MQLDNGESAEIALADFFQEKQPIIILDDYEAKVAARELGFHVTGTVGILMKAASNGLIESPEWGIRKLRESGLSYQTILSPIY